MITPPITLPGNDRQARVSLALRCLRAWFEVGDRSLSYAAASPARSRMKPWLICRAKRHRLAMITRALIRHDRILRGDQR